MWHSIWMKAAALAAALVWVPVAAAEEPQFLEPEVAFRMEALPSQGDTVNLQFTVADGYYMYRDKFKFSVSPQGAEPQPVFPAAESKVDPQFGETQVYRQRVTVPVRLAGASGAVTLTVRAQGCADAGLCYPPFTRTATVTLPAGATAAPQDESSRIGELLGQQSLALALASFFGFGLLLSFTPCVLPMVPILSGIIVGQGQPVTRRRGFTLSLAYVLGMAATYTAAGVAAGLSGTMLSAALQNPWVLGTFAAIFVLLSLSMFGFYELQLPASIQSRLNDSANKRGSSLVGLAFMGALSALIVGPCVAAPLAGALLFIAKTGNAWLGGAALFVMAMGMGVPLLLVGVAAGALLPRAGMWMEGVKKAFGVMLLGVALWLVSPVLPGLAVMLLLAALMLYLAVYLHALDPLPPQATGWSRFWKGTGVLSGLFGAALLLGALAGARDPLQPLAVLQGGKAQAAQPAQGVAFERVRSVEALQARLARATRPVMLDFYADWCVSCKEMEHLTFASPEVQQRMQRMELVQVDVTDNTDHDKALLKRHGLFGPPGIIVMTPGKGEELRRVVGFQDAATFTRSLDEALALADARGDAPARVAAAEVAP